MGRSESVITEADLDEGIRLVETDPFDCCVFPCDACVWLEENAKALITGCRERDEYQASLRASVTSVDRLMADRERLRVEVERLREAIERVNGELEYDCSEDAQERAVTCLEQALADGQGEDDE